jgi:hypothetical protein
MQGSIFQKANKNDYNRWKKHILKKIKKYENHFPLYAETKPYLPYSGIRLFTLYPYYLLKSLILIPGFDCGNVLSNSLLNVSKV